MQAIRHTRGDGVRDLLSIQRPNESEFIRSYRMQNIRLVTQEGTVKFNDKAARIINNSNYTIVNESDELREWLAMTSFPLENGDRVHFREYFTRFVLPCSFEDPNALLVAFPYNPDNPLVPPANPAAEGGLMPNEPVGIKTKVVPSERLVFVDDHIFAWDAGVWSFRHNNNDFDAPFFFICDRFNYYRYIPVGFRTEQRRQQEIRYELQLWYFHDTGEGDMNELPVNILGGTLVKSDYHTYYDSFIKPYFENGDEAMVTLSDYQAVKIRNAYPTRVLQKTPCTECDGVGKIKVRDDHGHEGLQQCGNCSGTGTVKDLSPFKDVVIDSDSGFGSENQSNRPIIEYVSPPLDSAVFLKQDWQDWLDAAMKSINLDVMLDIQESGAAKEHRLTDLRDMLMKIGNNIFDVMEHYLWYVECLLQPNRNQRQRPVIIRPTSYKIKTVEMLMAAVKDAPLSDRFTANMAFIKEKYAGDEQMIRLKELALQYAPLLMVNDNNELQLLIASGAYSQRDIVKRDRAEWALMELAKTLDLINAEDTAVFARLDEILAPFLPASAIPIVGANGQ